MPPTMGWGLWLPGRGLPSRGLPLVRPCIWDRLLMAHIWGRLWLPTRAERALRHRRVPRLMRGVRSHCVLGHVIIEGPSCDAV